MTGATSALSPERAAWIGHARHHRRERRRRRRRGGVARVGRRPRGQRRLEPRFTTDIDLTGQAQQPEDLAGPYAALITMGLSIS